MSISSGIVTRSRAKVLTTTIEPCSSDEEDTSEPVSCEKTSSQNGAREAGVGTVSHDGRSANDQKIYDVILKSAPKDQTSSVALYGQSDRMEVKTDSLISPRSGLSIGRQHSSQILANGVESKRNMEIDNLSQYSSTESAASAKEALSDAVKQWEAAKQFDDDYEDDGFLLKAKRKRENRASSGHVPAVDIAADIHDEDLLRINQLFGQYEYEDRDGPKGESEEESILSDPSDLNQDSELEDEYLVEDDIENYGKDSRPRKINCFIDDEAVEDNTKLDCVQCNPNSSSDDETGSDGEEDRAIKAPLKKKDFLDEEAVEDNNLKSLYGWSDCSGSEDEGENWKWNHEESEEGVNGASDGSDDEESEEGVNGAIDVSDDEEGEMSLTTSKREELDVTNDEVRPLRRSRGFLDSSDDEDGDETIRQRRKSKPRVIDDDDDVVVCGESHSMAIVGASNSICEVINKVSSKVDFSRKSSTSTRDEITTKPCDETIPSTSSVFTVMPLDPNYQPGRKNHQTFKISQLESNNIQIEPSLKRKRSDNHRSSNIARNVERCKISDDFMLGHDLLFVIDLKKLCSQCEPHEVAEKLTTVLRKGLGDRVKQVVIKECDGEETGGSNIVIGLNVNVDRAYDTVLKGPSADNAKEVKSFRAFWGNRVEIRRYPDLTVLASVHFPAATLAEKRKIVPEIVCHLLKVHFKIHASDISTHHHEVDKVLICKRRNIVGTGEEDLLAISESFERLRKKLRELKDLPLGISSIKGISPAFRGAEVFPLKTSNSIPQVGPSIIKHVFKHGCLTISPGSNFIPPLVKVHDVVLELETSGKWPDDLTALRHVKTQVLYNFMTQIVLTYKLPVRMSDGYLDILHESFVFRVRIAVKKEIILLRQVNNETGITLVKRGKIREADELEMRNEYMPQLTSALNGIATQYVTYNTVVRVAKRWLSSQYLFNLLSELVVELIIARVYLSPSDRAYSGPPNSPLTGFMRFLELVSKFPWGQQPFIVDINNEFTEQKITSIKKAYQQMKDKHAFMICTPYDLSPGYFARVDGVINSVVVFNNFVRNARSSFNCLTGMIRTPGSFSFLKVFQHPMEDYHVVIYLRHEFIASSALTLEPGVMPPPNKRTKIEGNVMPVIDFDVVANYLESLREAHNQEAIFVYDNYGGTKILVCFTPETLKKFSKSSDQSGINYEKIIENFHVMGHGIVKDIKVNPDKWL